MEFLKELFAGKALSYEELQRAVQDKGIKLADLSQGQYVDKQKFDNKFNEITVLQTQLNAANDTIKDFQNTENDLKTLRQKAADYEKDNKAWQEKYDNVIKDYKLREALTLAGARNPKAVAAVLDLSKAEFKEGDWSGLDDIISAHKKSEAYMYKDENQGNPPPKFTKPAGQNGTSTLSKQDIFNIKDGVERTKAIQENIKLFN